MTSDYYDDYKSDIRLEQLGITEPRYYIVHQFDNTCNIVLGNPYLNPPPIKEGMTLEEARAFIKLLREN